MRKKFRFMQERPIKSTFLELKNYFLGGYTFYFRWPVYRCNNFYPSSIFLGPALQSLIFLLFCCFFQYICFFSQNLAGFLSCVCLSCLTGFFHEDGFADTLDSLGVSKFDNSELTLNKIHAAMKDSRLGAFGVNGVVFVWALRYLSFFEFNISWHTWALILLSSRSIGLSCSWILARDSRLKKANRSAHLMDSISAKVFSAQFFFTAVLAMGYVYFLQLVSLISVFPVQVEFRVFTIFCSFMLVLFLVYQALKKTSLRSEGLSGDLIGGSILLGEMMFPLVLKMFRIF